MNIEFLSKYINEGEQRLDKDMLIKRQKSFSKQIRKNKNIVLASIDRQLIEEDLLNIRLGSD